MGNGTKSEVHQFSPDTYQDDGEEIRMLVETGLVNYGTTRQKRCGEIRITAKRGAVVADAPKLFLSWNDEDEGWSNEEELSLGETGERDPVLRLERTGIFRTRKYRVVSTDNVPIVLAFPEHDIEVLNR